MMADYRMRGNSLYSLSLSPTFIDLLYRSVLSNTENEKPTIVSFKNSVSVVLVPTRDEYIKHRLFDSLWYNCSDYSVFTADAMREVDSYISTNDSDLKAALTGLYQSKGESNPLKVSNINSSNSISVSVSSSSSASNNNLNNIPDDEYGNFVDFDNLPIRMIMSTQSSFALEDEPQFVLDL